MVVATRQSDSLFSSGRLLDEDKITKALNNATGLGAEYAEIRLVSETTNTASLKDGKLERAIPGQEVGVTMRILADGAWGVHSTSDIASIVDQVESTLRLAKAVAARRSPSQHAVGLAEVPIIEDEIHWRSMTHGSNRFSTFRNFWMRKRRQNYDFRDRPMWLKRSK